MQIISFQVNTFWYNCKATKPDPLKRQMLKPLAIASIFWLVVAFSVHAQIGVGGAGVPLEGVGGLGLAPTIEATALSEVEVPMPSEVKVLDLPNDDGSGIVVIFEKAAGENEQTFYTVYVSESPHGPWHEAVSFGASGNFKENFEKYFPGFYWFQRHWKKETVHVAPITQVPTWVEKDQKIEPQPLKTGKTYYVKLIAEVNHKKREFPSVLQGVPRQDWFNTSKTNNFIFAVIFGAIILYFIGRARRDPNLFIRKIAGLDAVEEAIGRATEMGKPLLYLNGMDDLSSLSTIAALNILGRVSRRVANYQSELMVPTRDPVVLTVAQEVVKQGYLDAGRPDAYKEDNIFFLTSDQFSFTAAVSGIMMREKPAANFFMGYYYAESLILAETGATTGAIQIAGTDSTTQLPFFITTCDYTLIGEELYAASVYLSREPLLLGSLKGQDVGKAFMMVVILIGTILMTVGVEFVRDLFKALT